jgi:hypothetical protein
MYTLDVVLVTRIGDYGKPQDFFAFLGYHSPSDDYAYYDNYVSALSHVEALDAADNPRVNSFDFNSEDGLMCFAREACHMPSLSLRDVLWDTTAASKGDFVWFTLT